MNYNDIYQELNSALKKTTTQDLTAWGKRMICLLPKLFLRRVKNLSKTLFKLGKFGLKEVGGFIKAGFNGRFVEHSKERYEFMYSKTTFVLDIYKKLVKLIVKNPRKYLPGLLAVALGAVIGSGGIDANGGIPDQDISLFGIEDHRSIFTHSIIAGTIVEFCILAIANFSDIVIEKIPDTHSVFWDKLSDQKDDIFKKLSMGISAGIAYHLAIDGSLQVAPYKDLPISMPMEAHQSLFEINAMAEGIDVANKKIKS
ncbi:MAG: hypothetical protein PHR82_09605 [Endomicrobiaceae bacterium]|nr:hypothetical protein [Endomicrobiaceae bacterium]